MRITAVVGARPNLIKIASLIAEMSLFSDVEHTLVHTGQHHAPNLSEVFFRQLGIPKPDYNLAVGSGTHAWQTAQVMLALEPLVKELAPDLVLVVGDVNSTMATALVTSKLRIPLAHVEAGLRSFDRSMPEEINRIVTDVLADFLFTTERSGNENLQREGIPGNKVFFVGNVMIDTLLKFRDRALALQMPARCNVVAREYGLLTLHRPSNVDSPEEMAKILEALQVIQERLPILFPIHPRTLEQLRHFGLIERISALRGIKLLDPLGYLEFLGLMMQARLVLTDSGGIQEETTILDVPCLTLRDNTERPVTVLEGTNELVGNTPKRVIQAVWRVLDGERKQGRCPELWDGHAAHRVISILHEKMEQGRVTYAASIG